MNHSHFMREALLEAQQAAREDEVPVGAVLVAQDGTVLAKAHNRTIALCDPTAHAEILALRAASLALGNYRLLNTALYVTIEPCIMCMGALLQARVARIVFGARDPKCGGAGSCYNLAADTRLNHTIAVQGGLLENECRELIQDFFRTRRLGIKRERRLIT
ncbi:MAG: tRNA adenosine(34) deaminase TadA [Deltaproteobacteria bacterium]|nr:tRNA adenosine(34) deaminase TadA [Deltaproteobacteria bacterium]MBW1794214.1 tRNA adenosine(34) deaminase TadA [Deltaproteobacteria bacterium]MBW2330905.1 tRNA adenosine(34) deaminase TadA [Deltaproteobacteria bacterium]